MNNNIDTEGLIEKLKGKKPIKTYNFSIGGEVDPEKVDQFNIKKYEVGRFPMPMTLSTLLRMMR